SLPFAKAPSEDRSRKGHTSSNPLHQLGSLAIVLIRFARKSLNGVKFERAAGEHHNQSHQYQRKRQQAHQCKETIHTESLDKQLCTLPRRTGDCSPLACRNRIALRSRYCCLARAHLADACLDLIDCLAQHAGRLLHRHAFFRRQRQFDLLADTATANNRRHGQTHIADAVQPLLQAADRQYTPAIACQRFNDLANRQSDRETRAALELDDLRPRRLRILERLALHSRREGRPLLQRQTSYRGARPNRHHAVAVFAEDHRLHLRGRHFQTLGQVATKPRCVKLRAQADDALPRQTTTLHGQIRQYIYRVTDDDEISVVLQAGTLDLFKQRQEQIDVAVDEVQ